MHDFGPHATSSWYILHILGWPGSLIAPYICMRLFIAWAFQIMCTDYLEATNKKLAAQVMNSVVARVNGELAIRTDHPWYKHLIESKVQKWNKNYYDSSHPKPHGGMHMYENNSD